MKIKKGDQVVVISGRDKGKIGVITKALPEEKKVIIDGINIRKVHIKPSNSNTEGGVFDVEKPIHVSNVMLLEGKKGNEIASRIGYKRDEGTGKKYRYMKKTGTRIS